MSKIMEMAKRAAERPTWKELKTENERLRTALLIIANGEEVEAAAVARNTLRSKS